MASLICAIMFAVVAGMTVGNSIETTDSLFLETTLRPVVELTINSVIRSSPVSSNPLPSITEHSNAVNATDLSDHDQIFSIAAAATNLWTTVLKNSEDSSFHSVSIQPNTNSQSVGIEFPLQSSSLHSSLMPSFTVNAVASHSITETIPSTVNEYIVTSFLKTESPTASISDSRNDNDGIMTVYADNGDFPDSSMAVEESSTDLQSYRSIENSETTNTTPISDAVVISSTESITPTQWYGLEKESISNGRDMLFDEAATTASPVTTATQTDSIWHSNEDHAHRETFVLPKRLSFVLKKQCRNDDDTLLETFEKLNEQLVGMLSSAIPINENQSAFVCENLFHVTISIKNLTDSEIKETVKNVTENFTFGGGFRVGNVYLYQNDQARTVLFSADEPGQVDGSLDEYTLSERELIAYIVAGISLATLVFILLTFCCIRILSKKQTTSLDLCDIPHLNLKLEDYKLTPIPRPTISFSEYGRDLFNPSYNEHTPKLEDTILNQPHFAADVSSPGARESLSFPREMRTFGGKKSCSRVQSLDVRPNGKSRNSWMSNSREKLSGDFERRNSGFDNVAFRKWF